MMDVDALKSRKLDFDALEYRDTSYVDIFSHGKKCLLT